MADKSKYKKATFAGGCFWCMEKPYDEQDGVISTISGYSGGHVTNPTYKQVSSGTSGHTEVLQVTYDPEKISYQQLLDIFWKNIDPFDPLGQFCDKGEQYRSAIFTHDEEQKELAEASRQNIDNSGKFKEKVVTEISNIKNFYPAEDYHQDYYKKNPIRYKFYRYNCRRDQRLHEIWAN